MVEAEEPRESAPPEQPKKKRKKKASAGAATAAPEKTSSEKTSSEKTSPEKPKKAAPPGEGTPAGDKLREAMRAFDAGDYGLVRARTAELKTAADPDVRAAALELRERTEIDPLQIVVVLACLAVLITIVFVWVV